MDEFDTFMVGRELEGNWIIEAPREIQRDTASACRSYLARNKENQTAFVKILDPRANGSLVEARNQLEQFIYEGHITEVCATRNMRRVVRGLHQGAMQTPPPFSLTLHYLIFEWAERDVRSFFESDERAHIATILRWLHHTVTAIGELHFSEIVHQDVRPANVVVMPNLTAKVGGLGRALHSSVPRQMQQEERDATYAAPEILYGEPIRSIDQRFATDMYAFGSLAYFLLSGLSLNAEVSRILDPMHHWSRWRGTLSDALPYVLPAFEEAFHVAITNLDPLVAQRLGPALRELCSADPKYRGHPSNRQGSGSPYGVERYVSLFNLLASEAEWRTKRAS
jgi:serine/threonine protein kinase